MAISALESRTQILDDLAVAVDKLALSIACLGEAFELLDVNTADRLEAQLFRPVQKAFGRAKRTHTGFAARMALESRPFASPPAGRTSQGVKAFIGRAIEAAAEADHAIAELQDSLLPVEAGDAELRAGLAETREHLAPVTRAARDFLRGFGR